MKLRNVEDNTLISDISGLLPAHISTQEQLNEWEAENITKAIEKYLNRKVKTDVTAEWLKKVHKDMFDETWSWAGKFRKQELNIGIPWHSIPEQLRLLIDDLKFWQTKSGKFTIFEQGVRLHHRLAKIHPFLNGNGRHARLVLDIFLYMHDEKLPTWPNRKLITKTDVRKKYIKALKAADTGDYFPLERFINKLR